MGAPFALRPAHPFLAARPAANAPQAQLVGFPFEATASFRSGAAFAPQAIRTFSESIETYSPHQERDLEDLILWDRGDLVLEEPLNLGEHLPALRDFCAQLETQAPFTLYLGGEHTATLAFLSPEKVADPNFHLIVLDAHTDLRETYQGSPYSHAAWARRALEWLGPERLIIAGARSGLREEFALARSLHLLAPTPQDLLQRIQRLPAEARIHLSVDLDVLDLALAPGTGNPEPLGWRVEDVLTVLQALPARRVLSADLVEYSPPHDPHGATGVLAAWLVREMLLALTPAQHPPEKSPTVNR